MKKSEAVRLTAVLFDELNDIICTWDPYGLSRKGEISDEFSDEVWNLLRCLPALDAEEQVISKVREIFRGLFPDYNWDYDECCETGRKIYKWWQQSLA